MRQDNTKALAHADNNIRQTIKQKTIKSIVLQQKDIESIERIGLKRMENMMMQLQLLMKLPNQNNIFLWVPHC